MIQMIFMYEWEESLNWPVIRLIPFCLALSLYADSFRDLFLVGGYRRYSMVLYYNDWDSASIHMIGEAVCTQRRVIDVQNRIYLSL